MYVLPLTLFCPAVELAALNLNPFDKKSICGYTEFSAAEDYAYK
jgi:hypothetical protein